MPNQAHLSSKLYQHRPFNIELTASVHICMTGPLTSYNAKQIPLKLYFRTCTYDGGPTIRYSQIFLEHLPMMWVMPPYSFILEHVPIMGVQPWSIGIPSQPRLKSPVLINIFACPRPLTFIPTKVEKPRLPPSPYLHPDQG